MAREYVSNADFNENSQHFDFQTVGENTYLRLGGLNTEDKALVKSFLTGTALGFFEGENRRAVVFTAGVWDDVNKRIAINSIPSTLTIGTSYDIRSTQARPGTPGEDGDDADLDNLVINTRGELIATSSYLPQNTLGNNYYLDTELTWTLNPDSEYVRLDESHMTHQAQAGHVFTRGAIPPGGGARGQFGILNMPLKKVADHVNGIWVVTENLGYERGDGTFEVSETFVPFGGGSVEDNLSADWWARYIIHFGRASANSENTSGADVLFEVRHERNHSFLLKCTIRTFGDTLPSTQCRVKVYLSGVFLTQTES